MIALVVGKDGAPRAATPDTILQAEDEIVAVTSPENEEALRTVLAQQ